VNKMYHIILILIVVAGCVGVDQAAKLVARRVLVASAPISLLGGLVVFEYAENAGAFMSLGARLPVGVRMALWIGFVGVVLGVGLVYLACANDLGRRQALALACVIGGGGGNLVDRIVNHGAVIDYVSVGLGRLRTGVLNIADLFVTFGVVVSVWLMVRSAKQQKTRCQNTGSPG